ncbi:MAG: hypothetical protein LIP01_12225, partial [Tannerellaceae bacterium]|nr:hypothetical protein [Tannerellaceae bacterium]
MKDKQNIHLIQEPDASELLKYLKNESSEAEKQRVEQWITAHEENSLIASRFATLYYACRNYFRISLRDTEGAYNQVQKKIRRRKNIRYMKKLSVGVSAAACII